MDEWHVPGVAIAVLEDGELRHQAGLGVRAFGSPAPVTPFTRFRVASLSKMLTGFLAMQEISAGRLSLDAPGSDSLGDLALADPFSVDQLTLRGLLTHSSGLQTQGPPKVCDTDTEALERVLTEEARDYALWTPPGELYNYANAGFALTGLAVQRSAGEPFAELAAERLFQPAGMERATYDVNVAWADDHATGHTMDPETGLPLAWRGLEERSCAASFPSGGLIASVTDMAQVVRALLHDGDPWLSPEEFAAQGEVGWAFSSTSSYGFGLQRTRYREHPMFTHHGSVGGFFAMLAALPEDGLGVVVLVNADVITTDPPSPWSKASSAILRRALDAFLGLGPAEASTSVRPVEEWGRYEGRYRSDFDFGRKAVELRGEALWLIDLDSGGERELVPYSRDSFQYPVANSLGGTSWTEVGFDTGTSGDLWLISGGGAARRVGRSPP